MHDPYKPFQQRGQEVVFQPDVFDFLMATLPPNAFKIFMVVYRNHGDRIAIPEFQRVTGIKSDKTVRSNLGKLAEMGLIVVTPYRGTSSRYQLNKEWESPVKITGVKTTPVKITAPENCNSTVNNSAVKDFKDFKDSRLLVTETVPRNLESCGLAEKTPPTSSSSKKSKVPLENLREMVNTLESATGMDQSLNYSRLAKLAKDLYLAGFTDHDIRVCFCPGGHWYTHDWRGKRGDTPDDGHIRKEIKRLLTFEHPVPESDPIERWYDAFGEYVNAQVAAGATYEQARVEFNTQNPFPGEIT